MNENCFSTYVDFNFYLSNDVVFFHLSAVISPLAVDGCDILLTEHYVFPPTIGSIFYL